MIGDGDEAHSVEQLASSAAVWTRLTHKVGWFKRFHLLQSTPAEMVLVRNFLLDAHRMLGGLRCRIARPVATAGGDPRPGYAAMRSGR